MTNKDETMEPILGYLCEKMETAYRKNPHRFFTEHDLHSEFFLITTEILEKEGKLCERTDDGFVVSRIHHEYPTPFRCHMKGSEFNLITEKEFEKQRLNNPRFRARRGYLDFVVLNSEYISSNRLNVISGKRYSIVKNSLEKQQYPALDLALEVVFYPIFDDKVHEGIMKRRAASTVQDYKKLIALMEFPSKNTPFCKEAGMIFLSNTPYVDRLEKILESVRLHEKVLFLKILASKS